MDSVWPILGGLMFAIVFGGGFFVSVWSTTGGRRSARLAFQERVGSALNRQWKGVSLRVPMGDVQAEMRAVRVLRADVEADHMGLRIEVPLAMRGKVDPEVAKRAGDSLRRRFKIAECKLSFRYAKSRLRLVVRTANFTEYVDYSQLLLDAVQEVAEEVNAQRMGPWCDAAEALDLTLTMEDGLPSLKGTLAGCPLEVQRLEDQGFVSWFRVDLSSLPGLFVTRNKSDPNFRVVSEVEVGPPVEIENALVARLLSIAGDDSERVRALFRDQDFIDALLPLIHGNPGSQLTETGLDVLVEGSEDPMETLGHMQVVVEALRRIGDRPLPKEALREGSAEARRAELKKQLDL